MAKLKRLGVLFSAKLQAIVMAVVGLIAGILFRLAATGRDVCRGWAL